jgi:hypothetical protein
VPTLAVTESIRQSALCAKAMEDKPRFFPDLLVGWFFR